MRTVYALIVTIIFGVLYVEGLGYEFNPIECLILFYILRIEYTIDKNK